MTTPGRAAEPEKEKADSEKDAAQKQKPPVADAEGTVESGPNPGSDGAPSDSGGANL